jgi:hypothetical protein
VSKMEPALFCSQNSLQLSIEPENKRAWQTKSKLMETMTRIDHFLIKVNY